MIVPLDVRYGFRKLNNSMGFTVLATACLALGTCASVTLFSVVDDARPAGERVAAEPLLLLAIVTALFMLAVCASLGGLLLVRMAARQEEIGVRLALGVTCGRLVRQLLTESVILSLLGGGAGFPLALFTLDALQGLSPELLPTLRHTAVGARAIVFTLGLSLGSGVLFGLVPALWSTRRQGVALHRGGEGVVGRRHTRPQKVLVVGQIAVSLTLLVCTGLFVRAFQSLELAGPPLLSWLFESLSLAAVLVTVIGLYGTLSYAASCRIRELGIRMALGARASGIVILVLRRGLALTLAGLALGLAVSSWATSLFAGLLRGVAPAGPAALAALALLLGVVGLAAASLPAYRATRVDPMAIIRHH
ncbi:MAG TPA: FtsX-like permease family protein [Thermoanaerobaculia bacterium]|jgi:ABC-type antimicrobial peptide transport system permease subunit